MTNEVIVGLLSLSGTLCGTFAGILTSTKLSNYRIEQLEKKVEKHNSVYRTDCYSGTGFKKRLAQY